MIERITIKDLYEIKRGLEILQYFAEEEEKNENVSLYEDLINKIKRIIYDEDEKEDSLIIVQSSKL